MPSAKTRKAGYEIQNYSHFLDVRSVFLGSEFEGRITEAQAVKLIKTYNSAVVQVLTGEARCLATPPDTDTVPIDVLDDTPGLQRMAEREMSDASKSSRDALAAALRVHAGASTCMSTGMASDIIELLGIGGWQIVRAPGEREAA